MDPVVSGFHSVMAMWRWMKGKKNRERRPSNFGKSQAGWSAVGEIDDDEQPLCILGDCEEGRYEERDFVGAGGMGEVHLSRDRWLVRDVALKKTRVGGSEFHLLREARLAARLEHPNIVGVYNAGQTDDGELFYTMRLIRGQSLFEILGKATSVEERLSYLGHYRDTCNAVAFAHSRGIVHRDLKPANIMIGEFGETQIVDWGLATFAEKERARAFDLEIGFSSPTSTLSSAGVGTLEYMSPEQKRGDEISLSFDVWALGAILYEFLVGTPPGVEEQLLGSADGFTGHGEVKAICQKALHVNPAQRYESAAMLAADIGRYLDGRRVEAHEYRPVELLQRLLSTWRIPIAVGMVALVALAVVIGVSLSRISNQRNRAIDAETRTQATLQSNTKTLAWALQRQALSAFSQGELPEAEMLAAHSLLREDSPQARGVLAAIHAASHPTRKMSWQLPDCRTIDIGPGGAIVCVGDSEFALWTAPTGTERGLKSWSHPGPVGAVRFVGSHLAFLADNTLTILLASTGNLVVAYPSDDHLLAVDSDHQYVVTADNHHLSIYATNPKIKPGHLIPCGEDVVEALGAGGGLVAVTCAGGTLEVYELSTGTRMYRASLPARGEAIPSVSLALSISGDLVAVGDVLGGITVVRVGSGLAAERQEVAANTPIRRLVFFDESTLLLNTEQNATALWNFKTNTERVRFPRGSREIAVAGRSVLVAGSVLNAWHVPERMLARTFFANAGLSSATLSPDGNTLVGTAGDGRLNIWRLDGRVSASPIPLSENALKRAVFRGDGSELLVATSDLSGMSILSPVDWSILRKDILGRGARRLALLPDGAAVVAHYGDGLLILPPDASAKIVIPGPTFVDTSAMLGQSDVKMLSAAAKVYSIGQDLHLKQHFQAEGAIAIAAMPRDDQVAIAHDSGVQIYSLEGQKLAWFPSAEGGVLALAVSPDGRWCVSSNLAGSIDVWDLSSGALAAVLPGHSQRVPFVGFTSANTLLSAGWDGSARLWNLDVLTYDPRLLLEIATRVWGPHMSEKLLGKNSL